MKLGIMQPYLFPYLGYFQLINAVDKFVVYDDVQYIKGGWINRNRILIDDKDHLFTFSIKKESYDSLINERVFHDNFPREKKKFLKTLTMSYDKAPFFKETKELIEDIFICDELNVVQFVQNSLEKICNYLDIKTEFILSSDIDKDGALKGEKRVVDIVKNMKAEHYVNQIGGKGLYSVKNFEDQGIKLNFLQVGEIKYKQHSSIFIPDLSIIDILMFKDRAEVKKLLHEHVLV